MAEYEFTGEGLTAALAALGDTIRQVRDALFAGGWRGYVCDCARCPVAAYLMDKFPGAEVNVGERAYLRREVRDDSGLWTETVDADLPDPVWNFVDQFDQLRYPELIKGARA